MSKTLKQLIAEYERKRRPLQVEFRALVKAIRSTDRATHQVHPYPGKLLLHIPHYFLNDERFRSDRLTVLDPFCGSGTVLLEGLLTGQRTLGVDINPLARLISSVKTTPIEEARLAGAISRLEDRMDEGVYDPLPDLPPLLYWFHPHVLKELGQILSAINRTRDPEVKDFFRVCLSACIRRVSLADPRISVPVRLRADQYPKKHPLHDETHSRLNKLKKIDVCREFLSVVTTNQQRMNELRSLLQAQRITKPHIQSSVESFSTGLKGGTVDLVLTSPPYVGAQKYLRSSSLSIHLLGLCSETEMRDLESQSVGRERYSRTAYRMPQETGIKTADSLLARVRLVNPLRAHIASNFLLDMRASMKEWYRVLRPGGAFTLVIGNNLVCGLPFDSQSFLKEIALEVGFDLRLELMDSIRSRGLMTKRNKTAGVITQEAVLLFEK